MSSITTNIPDRARALWRWCVASAFRTALACTIVGCATLYGPASLRHQVAFPAFSYVTVILIVTDATLGDTLRGCWLGFYATVQSVGPAILSLWLIGPSKFTSGTISVAVALAAFVVVLPEGTNLIAKRIALGQIVITYVIGIINGVHTQAVMHPLHVAASTAVGVLATVLALLLPYPRLACWEVKQRCKMMAENASERLRLYVRALCAEDNALASASISQAKPLAIAGTKLLQSIQRYKESMKWERLPFNFLRSYYMNPGERLQEIEIPLRGMEMALSNTSSFPVRLTLDEEKKECLLQLKEHVSLPQKQIKNWLACDSLTVPQSNAENITKCLQTLQTVPTNHQDLSSLFFLFCMKLLHCKSLEKPTTSMKEREGSNTSCTQQNGFLESLWSNWSVNARSKRLMPAFKCSLSLGLATLFGLIYSKENGYWSGLPIAISLASAREAAFKVANVKAQGTVLGTVYGVFGCFVFERFLPIRFLSLLPWFIVTSFLRRSRMYGQAGGISAVIGAVLILGRKNFGPPSEFAIARIAETFIGLSCSIMVELLLRPTRGATLAKAQLSKTFSSLCDCIGSISLETNAADLIGAQKRLKLDVNELRKFIGEAEVEPNFWFLPFHSACYAKLLGSLSKMVDLLLFSAHAVGFLELESPQYCEATRRENVNKLDGDLKLFKEVVGSLAKCFEDVTCLKSLTFLEKEVENKNISCDLEFGKSPNPNSLRASGSVEEETERLMDSYLQHSNEMVDKFHVLDGQKEQKSQVVLSLSSLGFCMRNIIKETREIEKAINELVQWENPSSHINLYEISCKIQALNS